MFAVFIGTVIFIRVFVFLVPFPSPTIYGQRLHHYMFGLYLLLISIFINNYWIFSIGLALFVDELAFVLLGGKNHRDNYSMLSIIGTVIFVIIVYVLRKSFLIVHWQY